MRRFLSGSLFVGVLVAVVLVGSRAMPGGGGGAGPAEAVFNVSDPAPGQINNLSIDTNTAGNPANGLGFIPSVETCNFVATGGTIDIDVVVDEIDVQELLKAVQVSLTFTDVGAGAVSVTGVNTTGMMLGANAGSMTMPLDDPTPDAVSPFIAAALDIGAGTGPLEQGEGVLSRITLTAGATIGIAQLGFDIPNTIQVDQNMAPIPTINHNGALLAVGDVDGDGNVDIDDCPDPADLKIQQVDDAPTDVDVSVTEYFTITKTIHNNGPDNRVNAEVTALGDAPEGCDLSYHATDSEVVDIAAGVPYTLNGAPGTGPASIQLAPSDVVVISGTAGVTNEIVVTYPVNGIVASVPVIVVEDWDKHCYEPSLHTFVITNEIVRTDAFAPPDPNPANNTWTTVIDENVWAEADLKISAQSALNPPASIPVNTDTVLTFEKTIHNNGPFSPIDVDITASLSAPPDCTVTPNPLNPTTASLDVSVPTVVQESFTVNCSQPSDHSFTFNNSVSPTNIHVSDPNALNNDASTQVDIPVTATADIKISAQSALNPPTSIPVNTDTVLTFEKTLHNNGPFSPVDVDITASLSAPPDCTVTPDPLNPTTVTGLASSVPTVIQESFTVNCSQPSDHSFTFNNSISHSNIHVSDPNILNNDASTQVDIPVTATADVKISAQSALNPPTSFPINTDTVLTFEKTIHNNGPFTPVDIDITASLSAPPDCTVTADPLNPTTASLASSVPTVVQESFTVNCSQPSDHSFTFNNSISHSNIHVTDPDTFNNDASTQVTAAAIGQADVKDTSYSVIAAPPVHPVIGAPYIEHDATGVGQGVITMQKTVHNNGPYGPVLVDAIEDPPVVVQYSGQSIDPNACSVLPAGATHNNISLPVSTPVILPSTDYTLSCGRGGIEHDDDGDGLVDEDPVDGADNDGDTLNDEDSPFYLVTVGFSDSVSPPKDLHVVDPDPGNNGPIATQVTVAVVRPFTPDGNHYATSVDPEMQTKPDPSKECLLGSDCKTQSYTEVPGGLSCVGSWPGCQPLADIAAILGSAPAEFTWTSSPSMTLGAKVGFEDGLIHVDLVSGGNPVTPIPFSSDLENDCLPPPAYPPLPDYLPDGRCGVDIPSRQAALVPALGAGTGNLSWSSALDSEVQWVQNVLCPSLGALSCTLSGRYGGFDSPTGMPINVLLFDLDGGGDGPWLTWQVLDDPSAAPVPFGVQFAVPYMTDMTILGTADQLWDGTPIASETIKFCTVPAPPASIAALQVFVRQDTGESSTLTDSVVCGCAPGTDPDGDGVCDPEDNCPNTANPDQTDSDGDGLGNACDNCPDDHNPGQENDDGDAWGNVCDNCPAVPTPWEVAPDDGDCDGFTDAEEGFVGCDPADWCPDDPDDDAWPADLVHMTLGYGNHDGTVNILDIVQWTPPYFNTMPPDPNYSIRKDFNGDSWINILDITRVVPPMFNSSCTP